ncbi:MAG TPA: EamA family transporter [Microbacteriaceae bacterium]|nr:EamA family transporter [Microbacteriaceae bacterium]
MPVLALVIASLLWGTTGTVASFLPPEFPRVAVGAATMGIGGVVLFLVNLRRAVAVIRDRVARRWLALGLVAVIAYPLTFYPAMELAGVAIGNVLSIGTGPVFAVIIEWLMERRRPTGVWLISAVVATTGIGLLAVGGEGSSAGTGDLLPGIALGLVAGIAYAASAYSAGRIMRLGHASPPVMGATFGLGAIVLLPILFVTGDVLLSSPSSLGIVAYLVLGPTLIGYVLFGIGVRALATSTVLLITMLEPVVTTVLAVVVVGERLTVVAWLGMVGILVAIACITVAALGRSWRMASRSRADSAAPASRIRRRIDWRDGHDPSRPPHRRDRTVAAGRSGGLGRRRADRRRAERRGDASAPRR